MKFSEVVKSLFVDYSDGLHRFVYKKLGDRDDADEIVQDTFHNYLRLESQEEIENPQAFLYKTAHNLALNHLRKNGHRNAYLATLASDCGTLPLEREVFSQRDVDELQKRLYRLPNLTRDIFLSNRIDGKTYPEIGTQYGISISSVQKHMIKALKYLRKHLDRS